ncbi:hypothetical protein PAGU2196_46180 [Pseudomonas sp. PAGU 2196]|uniref:hypothetical protein n=1 Tax=Pseudomonas sp. PAGU 2196 TaxID=2793997 RepID=UPI001EDE0BA8|nr:hypothetical protein [Pseudomonas sp. PAGU 2196]GHS83784.1 hypothetical protein PAGU2196_46180 [Pseudomonas sp. PAGU 2196]
MTDTSEKLSAASVVSGSVMSFGATCPVEDREDIMLANIFAQQATRQEYASGLNLDWFSNYRRKLSFLGWDATPPPNIRRSGGDRASVVAEAVKAIEAAGSTALAEVAQKSSEVLRNNDYALKAFELNAISGSRLHFQMLPCIRHSGDFYDMVVFHSEFDMPLEFKIDGFLFLPFGLQFKNAVQSAELIRFNLRLFRNEFKAKLANVKKNNRALIHNIPLRRSDSL